MSSGVPTGFPDWSRIVTQVSEPLIDEGFTYAAEPIWTFGPIFCGTFPTIRFQMEQVGGGGSPPVEPVTFLFDWRSSAGGPAGETTETFYSDENLPISDAMAVMAPYLNIVATNLALDPSNDWELQVIGTMANADNLRPALGKLLIAEPASNVAPTSRTAFNADFITTGVAMLLATCDATSWQVDVEGFFNSNVTVPIALIDNGATPQSEPIQIFLPPYPVQVGVTNNDATTQVANISLIIP